LKDPKALKKKILENVEQEIEIVNVQGEKYI